MARKPRKLTYYAKKAVRDIDADIMVGAIDVETEGLGGKLLMVQWGISANNVMTATGDDMVARMFDFVMQYAKPVVWYSHFAQYDWRYFLDYLVEKEYPIEIGMRTETDIYEIRIGNSDGEQITLRDSYALWNSPLEKLADTFCPEIPKLKIDIEKFDPQDPEHIAYAKRDVQILLVGMPRLFDLISEHFEVVAGATTAGTALKAWQRSLSDEELYNATEYGPQEEFIRQAYYGGLVFLTSNKAHENCITFDINSSYPSVMDEFGVPYGRIAVSDDYMSGMPGIYRCRVRAPDGLIVPILPARNAKGSMRWYKGEFDTCVTNQELIFAAKHGYEILEIYEGICFEEMVFPFSDLIGYCKMLRKAFKGMSVEMLAKLIQNALYGKFGTRRQRLKMMLALQMSDEDFIGAMPYDKEGTWYVKKEMDTEMRCLPQWAVFITAHARLKLLSTIYKVGPENVLYGDTDSITIKSGFEHLVDSGDDYGQWKLEKEWSIFKAIAPKVYVGILKDGKYKGAAKGLPRKGITDDNWKELLQDGKSSAKTMSLASLRVAIKSGVKPAFEMTRKSSDLQNSSNFNAGENGDVRVKFPHER